MQRKFEPFELDELLALGKLLDTSSVLLNGRTTGVFLAAALLRIRGRDGGLIPLVPNRVQLEYQRRHGRRNIVLKARQLGISTWIAAQFFLKTITRPGTMTVQVAHTHDSAEAIFRIVHRFLDGMPHDLRAGPLRTSRASARQIIFPALDSEYRVESAGDRNAGRGITIQNLHCSEVARWPGDPAEILAGLLAATTNDAELVLESTPNGAAGCFYEEWMKSEPAHPLEKKPPSCQPDPEHREGEGPAVRSNRNPANTMVRHFFPWWWEPAYTAHPVETATLTDPELMLVNRHGLTLPQIGYRRRLRSGYGDLAPQEYAEDADTCFLTSGSGVFDANALDQRLKELTAPQPGTKSTPPAAATQPFARRLRGDLLLWLPPLPGRAYLVAVDPAAGGSHGDYSAAQVVDIETGMQCAELQSRCDTLELAQQTALLAKEYNHALLVVERNNHGAAVLAYLHTNCKYANIYSHGKGDGPKQNGEQEGWPTNVVTRPLMIGALGAALVEQPGLFQSRRLLLECRRFVRLRNGKTGAQAGAHDDCVMAMAIALAVRNEVLQNGHR